MMGLGSLNQAYDPPWLHDGAGGYWVHNPAPSSVVGLQVPYWGTTPVVGLGASDWAQDPSQLCFGAVGSKLGLRTPQVYHGAGGFKLGV